MSFNSLPRRSSTITNAAFQRNSLARRSAGPTTTDLNHFEPSLPRSLTEFDLTSVDDLALVSQHRLPQLSSNNISICGIVPITFQPPHQQHQQYQHHPQMSFQQKPREKTVTFENDVKYLHGCPATPKHDNLNALNV